MVWLIDQSYHILTNQPLQLAVLAEKPRLLLFQAVDVPDKDVIKVSAKDEMSSEYLLKKSPFYPKRKSLMYHDFIGNLKYKVFQTIKNVK